MKPIKIILTSLTALFCLWYILYLRYENVRLLSENNALKKDLKYCNGQIQIANDQVLEWNSNFKCTDYAKRNGIKYLTVTE